MAGLHALCIAILFDGCRLAASAVSQWAQHQQPAYGSDACVTDPQDRPSVICINQGPFYKPNNAKQRQPDMQRGMSRRFKRNLAHRSQLSTASESIAAHFPRNVSQDHLSSSQSAGTVSHVSPDCAESSESMMAKVWWSDVLPAQTVKPCSLQRVQQDGGGSSITGAATHGASLTEPPTVDGAMSSSEWADESGCDVGKGATWWALAAQDAAAVSEENMQDELSSEQSTADYAEE